MANQDPPLDEMQWRSPAIVQSMQGIHSNSVLFYFAESPYFDRTSNNAVVFNQALYNQSMFPQIQTREAFEGRLKTMSGLEFIVAQEPADMVTGTGVWVIRKQTRRKRQGEEDEITVHSAYFVVGENVYIAPNVAEVLGSRTLSMLTSLNKFFTKAASLPNFTPATGTSYNLPPSTKSAATQSLLGQVSKETTPLPDSIHHGKKTAAPAMRTSSSYLNDRLLEETLSITMKYGDEFMDEIPITGEPGAFHLSGTGRKEKDVNLLAVPNAAKAPSSAATSKAPTPAPPPLKTDIEPAKKGRDNKTPTKSPAGSKQKRKKSKVLSAGGASPS
ncbi:mediator of RNA polymeras-like protein II transcription subunit 6 [Amylocarpus encephaloides]|uniref:Mediator of RNA polymerase II transcription subunit 6 n=1 Tax=Amylocarpus encephaloides TaxID=45428 RepID=A0A9P7YEH7_9HELO|nr:mediator of RNA polymeras-like protein II transcription subunit 6 [Amylocarpus encephaloides]